MSTDQHPVDAVAPLPDDHMDTTAEQYANHNTAAFWFEKGRARELIVSTNAADPSVPDTIALAEARYTIAHLTNALRTHARDVADDIIRDLRNRQSTIVSAEMTIGYWAEKAGLDIDALRDAGKQAARTPLTADTDA